MKYITLLLVLFLASCRNLPVNKEDLSGLDFRLFQGTIAWDLAKAVEDEDTARIQYEVKNKRIPVDFKESRWKQTLLMLAVSTNKVQSVRCLLKLGASPNEPEDSINDVGDNPVIVAAKYLAPSNKILKLLLKFGGNPNSTECGRKQDNLGNWVPARNIALSEAVFTDFEKVRILVEAGANVNLQTETDEGAVHSALVCKRMDVLLFLLEKGADYNMKYERFNPDSPNPTYYVDILHELRLCVFPLNSKEHKDKLKVIGFLKERGMDYWGSPIPDGVVGIIKKEIAPKDECEFQEYIKKY